MIQRHYKLLYGLLQHRLSTWSLFLTTQPMSLCFYIGFLSKSENFFTVLIIESGCQGVQVDESMRMSMTFSHVSTNVIHYQACLLQ